VPGPLPAHPAEPFPWVRSAVLSQFVALIDWHGGRLLPI
jgi:hypothetical protein